MSLYVTRLDSEQPMVTGRDLQELGYKPGPLFRTILNHVVESQLNGVIETRDQALDFIRTNYPLKNSGGKG